MNPFGAVQLLAVFRGHSRRRNQVASNQRVLAVVSGPVHLMLPWACNEGHIVEKAK